MSLHVTESTCDPLRLLREVYATYESEAIPDGSGASHFDGPEKWIYGLDMVRVDPLQLSCVRDVVRELRMEWQVGRLVQVMVNRLRPWGELRAHRDGLPDNLRFHLPLVTSPAAYWWDEQNGRIHMEKGNWYGPVPYCGVMHAAGNPSPYDRVHLIADFERR